ncbi:MAG: ABC transporter permease [Erysipelothrix sp.]|nr:ABC transporter permease [Erysipelothrix sp.]
MIKPNKITKPDSKAFIKNLVTNHNYVFSLVVMTIIGFIANPNFLRFTNIMTLMKSASILGVLALGMTLVILIGQIDLSVGSMLALTGALAVGVYNSTYSIILTLIFCLGFGFLLGLFNGFFVGKLRIAGFVVTLATLAGYRSLTVQIGQGGPLLVDVEPYYASLRNIGYGKFFGIPNLVLIFAFATLLIWILLTKTKIGRYIYAVGSNEKATMLTGVNVDRIKILVFALSGMLAGLAAFMYISQMGAVDSATAGRGLETDAIAAVAIGGVSMSGGRGFVQGTFFGAIILFSINNILTALGIPAFVNDLIKGGLILIAVVLQQLIRKSNKD